MKSRGLSWRTSSAPGCNPLTQITQAAGVYALAAFFITPLVLFSLGVWRYGAWCNSFESPTVTGLQGSHYTINTSYTGLLGVWDCAPLRPVRGEAISEG